MLIIRSPLAVLTICPFGSYTDILGEKIRAGYRLTGTNITVEDLWHMMQQQPDIYIGMENSGIYNSILQVQNQVQADARLKLELINQLINRIMLYHTPRFTYQDEVFVASLLQKLGIMDAGGFMREVGRHMIRNRLLLELTDKYFVYGRQIAGAVDNTITDNKWIENRFQANRYLHNEIFKRLLTAECNNILYSYRNQVRTANAATGIHDVTWIEQADAIQLSQLRENVFYQTNSAFWQNFCAYETMPLEKNEWTEERVMQRMAVAVFENILQKIHYERQCYHDNGEVVWKDYTSILYQCAADFADVMERFRYYQSGKMMNISEIAVYGHRMQELLQDEIQLTELLVFLDSGAHFDDGSDALYADMRNSIVVSILENQRYQKQMSEKIRVGECADNQTKQENWYTEETDAYINELRLLEKTYQRLRRRNSEISYETQKTDAPSTLETAVQEAEGQNLNLPDEADGQEIIRRRAVTYNVNFPDEMDEPGISIPLYQGSYIEQFLNQHADILNSHDIPIMENERLLERINTHNINMKQLLENTTNKNDTNVIFDRADDGISVPDESASESGCVSVDPVQARRNALRVLENPQAVLEEIYENASAVKKETTKEMERVLSITDEQTRTFYEQLLGYRESVYQKIEKCDSSVISNVLRNIDTYFNRVKLDFSQTAETYNLCDETDTAVKTNQINKHIAEADKRLNTDGREGTDPADAIILYTLLNQIAQKEESISWTADDVVNITEPEELYDAQDRTDSVAAISPATDKMEKLHFIHKTVDYLGGEVLEKIREMLQGLDTSIKERSDLWESAKMHNGKSGRNHITNAADTQVLQNMFQNMKRELTAQSEKQLTSLVERSLKTQVHAISDKVYLELERRLRNEQRRRGC
ncbi:MAG: hypothetical protein K2N73_11040 [Lachnospiraceae bacterium]|nr:hypothetical protein [Lachnospiraceae bacterium]